MRAALWLLCFGCLWLPVFDDPPLHSGAFVQDVGPDSACVAMITRDPAVRSIEVVDSGGRAVPVQPTREPRRRHLFRLSGLAPDSRYRYRILDDAGFECDAGTLRTAPTDDGARVQFAVVGDSGDQPWWVWLHRSALFQLPSRWDWLQPSADVARIGERIAAATPDFVIHVGDIVYPWGHQGHYASGFFRPFAAALRQAPFYVALGNHDILDDEGRQALANFELPRNEITGDERCYSFAWGAVRVTVLDLGFEQEAEDRIRSGHVAREFLARQLERASEPWQVVVSHYPIHSASRQRDRADLIGEILPLLEANAVDLYLCGHDHTYQRFGRQGQLVEVVSGGGGKSLYEVRQDSRAQVAQSVYHWCAIEVVGRDLTLRARGIDGALIDTVSLRKGQDDPRLARLRGRNPERVARISRLQ